MSPILPKRAVVTLQAPRSWRLLTACGEFYQGASDAAVFQHMELPLVSTSVMSGGSLFEPGAVLTGATLVTSTTLSLAGGTTLALAGGTTLVTGTAFSFSNTGWYTSTLFESDHVYLPELQTVMGASTTHEQEVELAPKFDQLFASSADEYFEDGMDSYLSIQVTSLVLSHGDVAVRALQKVLPNARRRVVGEVLRCLGSIDDLRSHDARLAVLESALESHSPQVRDGAVLGLSLLKDVRAIPALETALTRETVEIIRDSIQELLATLGALRTSDISS